MISICSLTTEIKSPADGLKTRLNSVHSWCMLTTKIRDLAKELKTIPGSNSDDIQFSYIRKFYIYINIFSHQTTIINC